MKEEFKKREPEKNALLVKGKKILANKNDDNLQMELNLVDDKWSTLERRLGNGIDRWVLDDILSRFNVTYCMRFMCNNSFYCCPFFEYSICKLSY